MLLNLSHGRTLRHPAPIGARSSGKAATLQRERGISKYSTDTADTHCSAKLLPASTFSGLVFTLNHIAVNKDSAIICVRDSTSTIMIDGGGAGGGRILGGGAGGGRGGGAGGGPSSAAGPAAAVKAKTAFSLRLRPFGPHGEIVGRSDRAALSSRSYLRLKRATR